MPSSAIAATSSPLVSEITMAGELGLDPLAELKKMIPADPSNSREEEAVDEEDEPSAYPALHNAPCRKLDPSADTPHELSAQHALDNAPCRRFGGRGQAALARRNGSRRSCR